jgi:hypothetical protein
MQRGNLPVFAEVTGSWDLFDTLRVVQRSLQGLIFLIVQND